MFTLRILNIVSILTNTSYAIILKITNIARKLILQKSSPTPIVVIGCCLKKKLIPPLDNHLVKQNPLTWESVMKRWGFPY